MGEYQTITHTFAPVYDENSKILILGTFPSVKSRENQFYYGHPQNRLWRLLAGLFETEPPVTIEEKTAFLHKNGIAMSDVVAKCDIIGSSDQSIRNVVPSDLLPILETAKDVRLFANGATAYALYQKYLYPVLGREIVRLPSTSPANAAYGMDRLREAWKVILE